MTTPNAHASGLKLYRQRKAEEKELRVAELDELRKDATLEVVDGREYRVVRIPDRYGFTARDRL